MAQAARAQGLLAPGDGVLVAVSGGADSTALAALLHEAREHGLPLRLALAHLDHGWRGPAEAAADRAVVEALARRLGLPLTTAGPPDPPAPTEDAARRWRYGALARLAHAHGLASVATGHHLGDQAETFLLRLLRGAGPAGLAGIPPSRPLDHGRLRVVRPLLALPPRALRAFLAARGLGWRDDPTNAGPGERNRMRRRLAALEARHAGAQAHLARLAERLRARVERAAAGLEARLAADLVEVVPGHAVAVPRALLLDPAGGPLAGEALGLALRVLGRRLAADAHGPWFTRRHRARVEALLGRGGALDLPSGLALRAGPVRVWLLRRGPWPVAGWRLVRRDLPREAFDLAAFLRAGARWTAALDADVLGPEALLGTVEADERFTPLGAPSGRAVRIDDWLQRRGLPRAVRRAVPVVRGRRGAAWVVGQRVDAAHAVTDATRRVALLVLERAPSAGAVPRAGSAG